MCLLLKVELKICSILYGLDDMVESRDLCGLFIIVLQRFSFEMTSSQGLFDHFQFFGNFFHDAIIQKPQC